MMGWKSPIGIVGEAEHGRAEQSRAAKGQAKLLDWITVTYPWRSDSLGNKWREFGLVSNLILEPRPPNHRNLGGLLEC